MATSDANTPIKVELLPLKIAPGSMTGGNEISKETLPFLEYVKNLVDR